MFKKRSKKGLSHVDWAMSLGIFLLYLAWFFIFVKPVLVPSERMDVLLDILDDGVSDVIFQQTERIKVYAPAGTVNEAEPIIIPFDTAWPESEIAHSADYFVLDENRMFFLGNISGNEMFEIYYPHDALETTFPRYLVANEDRAWTGVFSAHFEDYLLDYIMFMNDRRLDGFTVEVDDTVIGGEGVFENWTFMAEYQSTADFLNISSYVFADNPRIYTYIMPADFNNHSVDISFATFNYTYFYFDYMQNGELEYGARERCRVYESDFLDLYDSESGLLITFDRNISFRLCTNETNVKLDLYFDVYSGTASKLNIFLHEGDVDDVISYPFEPVVGVTESLRTVSASKVSLLKNRDYDYLKQIFSYPKDREFHLLISSDVVSAAAGIEPPAIADVYARKLDGFILDENYDQQRVEVNLAVW